MKWVDHIRARRRAKREARNDRKRDRWARQINRCRILDGAMTTRYCPFVDGPCRMDCIHFSKAEVYTHCTFNAPCHTFTTIEGPACKLHGTK